MKTFTDVINAMRRIPQGIYTSHGEITVEMGLFLLQTLYNPIKAELDRLMSNAGLMDFYEIKKIQTECDNAYNATKTELELFKAAMGKDNIQNSHAPETQASEQGAAGVSTEDPEKVTLTWLKRKQWIKREQLKAKPPVPINGGLWEPPKEYEWRITKPIAFIYRGLMDAAENKEIPLEKDVIKNFMINNLKTKYGGDITSDSLTKADKSRQKPTK
jgi:hypothetical protein